MATNEIDAPKADETNTDNPLNREDTLNTAKHQHPKNLGMTLVAGNEEGMNCVRNLYAEGPGGDYAILWRDTSTYTKDEGVWWSITQQGTGLDVVDIVGYDSLDDAPTGVVDAAEELLFYDNLGVYGSEIEEEEDSILISLSIDWNSWPDDEQEIVKNAGDSPDFQFRVRGEE